MDFHLYSLVMEKEKNPSVYFDTKEKCDRWVRAIDWILDPSPVGYRASTMRRKPQGASALKQTTLVKNEERKDPQDHH